MKIQLNKKDVLWNYIGIIMNLGGNFLILPFLLFFLDDNYYGIWNVFVSLGGIVALFDFGFNTTFARNITFCWSGAKKLTKESVEYSDNAEGFKEFFEKEVPGNPLKAEYLIPIFIGELLEQGKMSVKVLKTNDTWYGMTYHQDVAAVRESFKEMLENGVYKADLFSDL